ncbi:hypothetical protein Q7P35_005512 [Cladosporium inversicolor]
MTAFRECFKDMPYVCWKRDRVLKELKLVCPRLSSAEKTNAKKNLRRAITFRTMMLQRFPYDTEEATARHSDSIHLLKEMMFLLREGPVKEWQGTKDAQESSDLETNDTDGDGHSTNSCSGPERTMYLPKTVAQDTVGEDGLHTFIESLSASIEDICSSWRRATEDVDITCAAADAIWLFRTVSAMITSTFCTSPTLFNTLHKKTYNFQSPFLDELDSVNSVTNNFLHHRQDTRAKYIEMIFQNAMKQRPGSIPLLHDLVAKYNNLRYSRGIPQSEHEFRSFEANIYTLLLLRLRDQWDISRLISLKSALVRRCERLSMLSSDTEVVQDLRDTATSALDITTIGCLSLVIEANIQRLLCENMGTPLVTVLAHFHVIQRLLGQTVGICSTMDQVCVKFAHLLFWDGEPQSIAACKESLQNWVMDSKLRSLQKGHSNFFEALFKSRNKLPPLAKILTALFVQPSTSEKKTKLQEDIHDYQAVFLLLMAIENTAKVESVGCPESMKLAFNLGNQLLEDHECGQILADIAKNVEKLQMDLSA